MFTNRSKLPTRPAFVSFTQDDGEEAPPAPSMDPARIPSYLNPKGLGPLPSSLIAKTKTSPSSNLALLQLRRSKSKAVTTTVLLVPKPMLLSLLSFPRKTMIFSLLRKKESVMTHRLAVSQNLHPRRLWPSLVQQKR